MIKAAEKSRIEEKRLFELEKKLTTFVYPVKDAETVLEHQVNQDRERCST